MVMKREWLAWELNWLRKHGVGVEREDLESYGEKPVEYITGWAAWRGGEVRVSEAVLIPRIETEELVSHAAKEIILREKRRRDREKGFFEPKEREGVSSRIKKPKKKTWRIAEVGTGSGVVAIGLAEVLRAAGVPNFCIAAGDISPAALKIARKNRLLRAIPSTDLVFWRSDLLSGFDVFSDRDKFDLIVANLPYIPTSRQGKLAKSVVDFEPVRALFGGEDGLDLIWGLIKQAPIYLRKGGTLWLEFDESQAETLLNWGNSNQIFNISIQMDQFERPRFARLTFK